MSAPTIPAAGAPQDRRAKDTELLTALLDNPYIPEVHDDPRVDEQYHQLEDPAVEDAFAHLAIDHPDTCHSQADYPGWQPGGAK